MPNVNQDPPVPSEVYKDLRPRIAGFRCVINSLNREYRYNLTVHSDKANTDHLQTQILTLQEMNNTLISLEVDLARADLTTRGPWECGRDTLKYANQLLTNIRADEFIENDPLQTSIDLQINKMNHSVDTIAALLDHMTENSPDAGDDHDNTGTGMAT